MPPRTSAAFPIVCVMLVCASAPVFADCVGGDPFDQTLIATSKTAFGWGVPADVEVAIGNLSQVASYTLWARGPIPNATVIPTYHHNPASGAGLFYLVKPADDPCGSWQSSSSAEPLRDSEIRVSCASAVPTEMQVEDAVTNALVGLNDPWSDPAEFVLYSERLQDELGCAFEGFLMSAGLVYNCGPASASGHAGLSIPTYGTLSSECFDQGLCYNEKCINADAGCSFSTRSQTAGCDESLVQCCSGLCLTHEIGLPTLTGARVVCETAAQMAALPSLPVCEETSCPGDICLEESCFPGVSGSVFFGTDNAVFLDARAARDEFLAKTVFSGVQEFENEPLGIFTSPIVVDFPPSSVTAAVTPHPVAPGFVSVDSGPSQWGVNAFDGQYLWATNDWEFSPEFTLPGEHLTVDFDSPQTAVGLRAHGGHGDEHQLIVELETSTGTEYFNLLESDQDSDEGTLAGVVFFGVFSPANPISSVTIRDPGFTGGIGYDSWYVASPMPGAQPNPCPCFNEERLIVEIEEWEAAWAIADGGAGNPLPVTCPSPGDDTISADFCGGDPQCQFVLPSQFFLRSAGHASATADSCSFQRLHTTGVDFGYERNETGLIPVEAAACAANIAAMASAVGCP